MTEIDAIALSAFISGAAAGGIGGLIWERHGWLQACLKRKLVKYNARTGRLVWMDGTKVD